jgi:hypothetical protein
MFLAGWSVLATTPFLNFKRCLMREFESEN